MIVRGRVEVSENTGVLWIGAAAGGTPVEGRAAGLAS
jgi:hypothetical protein